jgi:hypothetical protein
MLLFLSLAVAQAPGRGEGGTITGVIRDISGAPAVGVRVGVTPADGDAAVTAWSNLGQTDKEGRYRLDAVPAGRYLIVAGAAAYPTYFPGVAAREKGKILTVAAGQTIANPEFTLLPPDNTPVGAIDLFPELSIPVNTSGCGPTKAPVTAIAADDFISFNHGGGMMIYIFNRAPDSVTIRGDGQLTWELSSRANPHGVKWAGAASIPAEEALALIQKARSNGFWSLCANYSIDVTDMSGYSLTVRINGENKRVSVYAGGVPAWVRDLINEIGAAVEKHVWVAGDPKKETFSDQGGEHLPPTDLFNLKRDALYPKPGVTDLMRASANGDEMEVRRLLSAGADVHAKDASGWTTLMYASESSGKPEIISALLKAGAGPNARSSMGQTPLMAAASGGMTNKAPGVQNMRLLIAAGAAVNAQDNDGRTALMFAAQPSWSAYPFSESARWEPGLAPAIERISVLREAGANVSLRDANGHTVVDQFDNFAKTVRLTAEQAERIRRSLQ